MFERVRGLLESHPWLHLYIWMVNFMCQNNWPEGCPDTWFKKKKNTPACAVRFLEELLFKLVD